MTEGFNIIYSYSLQNAIEDGVLIEVFKNRWQELSGGKPIVASERLHSSVSSAALQEIWNGFVLWQKTKPNDRMFVTEMNGDKIWLMEDAVAFTMMYPSDY